MRLMRRAAVLLVVIAAAGCSLDYRAAEFEAQGTENIPDAVTTGLVYRVMKNSQLSLQLEASRAETYNERKQTELSDVRLTEYDSQGASITQGRADSVVFHSDTQDAEISGSVFVHSDVQEGDISTEGLSWKNKDKTLTADPNELVVVSKDDGSYISGRGFSGDFKKNEIRFSGPVEGAFEYENKDQ
jgi:LPS export ABC transporter protein LptC